MSKVANFLGSSSVPKGLREGALAIYCRRVYSSNISGLHGALAFKCRMFRVYAYVRPRCDETNLRRARPISASFSDGSNLRHSASKS